MKNKFIEKEKINLILEKKGTLINNFSFNNETINFLKMINIEYTKFYKQKECSINDLVFYERLLDILNKECGYCYKLTRDFENAIKNMKKGIYNNSDINEIEEDMMYIGFIISVK